MSHERCSRVFGTYLRGWGAISVHGGLHREGRAKLRSRARLVLAGFTSFLLLALTLTGTGAGLAGALTGPSPGPFVGDGFDTYTAPSQDLMTAWVGTSGFGAVGIYIGGGNRFDRVQPQLTPQWVSTQQSAGWHLLPIYFGPQPYCTTSSKPYRFTAANAASSGWAAANDAVAAARALGLATGSTIFNDIEAYATTDPACTAAVLTYQSWWTARLHDYGFLSGFYSSMNSGVRDQVAAYNSNRYVRPDYLWFARYDGISTVSDAAIPSSYWLHRRIKQYRGGAPETYGGQTLNVDRNQLDLTSVPDTAFGDVNGNGWPDLIARQTSSGSLFLYPGNGTGFPARVRIGAGWQGMNAITRFGDFDRDGHEDVIARESVGGALWLYRGTGAGFSSRVRLGWGWNALREITAVGDFNGDGYPDLVAVQNSTGSLFLYSGRGTSLAPARRLGWGWNAMSELVGVGDVNRDGHVDLIARRSSTGDLWLYPGTGTGFGATVRVGTGWNTMRDLTGVGDFDRDGFNDLVAVESATGRLFRYPGSTGFGTRTQVGSGWTTDLRPLL